MAFTHLTTVVADTAPRDDDIVGRWDVVEDLDGTFSVYDRSGGATVANGILSSEDACELARLEAAEFDDANQSPSPRR